MFKFTVRFTKALLLLSLITVISVGAGLACYVVQGGDLSALEQRISRTFDRVKAPAAVKTSLDVGKEFVRDVASFFALGPSKPKASSMSKAEEASADGTIRVYFAPCQPASPFGIDEAFINLLERAQRSIHGAFFELELPAAAEALIARHKAGVEVRLVSDSDYQGREAVQSCVAAGIPVVFDEREAFMHDKFCIVDGTQVWTGSTNITENCMYRNDNNALQIGSPALAQDYETEFDEMFRLHAFGKKSPRNTLYPKVTVGDVEIRCYFAPEDDVERAIVNDLDAARAEIDVMAFSFTSPAIASAMASRLVSGVKVRAVLDQRQAGAESSQSRFLAEKGASVRLDRNPYSMHNKVIIIDDATVITGSYNFTKSANAENDENVLILHSPDIAAQYKKKFEAIFGAN